MSTQDKAANQAQDLGGKVKEGVGGLTGDRDLQGEGKSDQAKASLKDVGEKLKDAAGDVGDKLKDAAGKVKDAVGHHDHSEHHG
jgi:uncharacterized protein YjbJ (UPF0337 family)